MNNQNDGFFVYDKLINAVDSLEFTQSGEKQMVNKQLCEPLRNTWLFFFAVNF